MASLTAWSTGYRATAARLGDVEELLVRYPKLRVYLMQAGWPYRDQTIALTHSYPDVYADLGNLAGNPAIPREEFYDYLHAVVRPRLGAVQAAPFLSDSQRADIFYRNAESFLGKVTGR